jgi:hypothetical protein
LAIPMLFVAFYFVFFMVVLVLVPAKLIFGFTA